MQLVVVAQFQRNPPAPLEFESILDIEALKTPPELTSTPLPPLVANGTMVQLLQRTSEVASTLSAAVALAAPLVSVVPTNETSFEAETQVSASTPLGQVHPPSSMNPPWNVMRLLDVPPA